MAIDQGSHDLSAFIKKIPQSKEQINPRAPGSLRTDDIAGA